MFIESTGRLTCQPHNEVNHVIQRAMGVWKTHDFERQDKFWTMTAITIGCIPAQYAGFRGLLSN